jgi:hypothetical protein
MGVGNGIVFERAVYQRHHHAGRMCRGGGDSVMSDARAEDEQAPAYMPWKLRSAARRGNFL